MCNGSIVEGETDEIVQPEQSSKCPPEYTNHSTGNVYTIALETKVQDRVLS
jgi:hypothetical protein